MRISCSATHIIAHITAWYAHIIAHITAWYACAYHTENTEHWPITQNSNRANIASPEFINKRNWWMINFSRLSSHPWTNFLNPSLVQWQWSIKTETRKTQKFCSKCIAWRSVFDNINLWKMTKDPPDMFREKWKFLDACCWKCKWITQV